MSAFQTAGHAGILARVGGEAKSLGRKGRADLKADPTDVDGIRGIVDQLLISEAHVGDGNAIIFCDVSGDPIMTLNSSGAHNIGKAGQITTFAGDVTIDGDFIVNGDRVILNTTVATIEDNIYVANSGPSGSRNAGYAVERYQVANNAGTGDVVTDPGALIATIADIGDQTGQDGTHVYLGAGASAVDDYFTGAWAKSADDNVRLVTGYNGTTKVATLATAWDTQPASNSQVQLYTPFTAVLYDESNNCWRSVALTANDVIVGDVAAQFAATAVTTLTASVGITAPFYKASNGDTIFAGGNGSGGMLFKTNGESGPTKLDIDHSDGITFYDDVQPDTDSAYDFGSSTAAWATGYFDTVTSLTANDRLKLGTDAQVLLSLPVFTTQQITDNIAAPAAGDLVYDSTTGTLKYRGAADWVSLASSGDTSGLTGTTSLSYTINSDVANGDGNASLVLQSGNGVDATSAGTLTYVYGAGANGGIWSSAAHVRIADDKQLKLGTDSDVTMAFVSGSSLFDVNVTGAVELDATGAIAIESSGGAISIGADDIDQNVNIGTDGERAVQIGSVNGAASMSLRSGTGNFVITAGGTFSANVTGAASAKAASHVWTETGLSNSGTNAPAAVNDVVFLRSDGLSKADAATLATAFARGAYTGTSGEVKRGTAVTFTKMFTNAGGTTYDNIAKGDTIWLAAAVADEYDTGVTPAKGRCSNRAPVVGTAGTVNMILGIANAASDDSTATVSVDFCPQYVSTN